jgi:hypothetical protein
MTTQLTPERHSFVWVLIREGNSDEEPVVDATRQPVPSVGHMIHHEPTDEMFYVTRVLWEIREGYPLVVKVFGKVVQDLGNGYCDFPAPTPKGEPP